MAVSWFTATLSLRLSMDNNGQEDEHPYREDIIQAAWYDLNHEQRKYLCFVLEVDYEDMRELKDDS